MMSQKLDLIKLYREAGILHELRWIEESGLDPLTVLERRKKAEPLAYILGSWPFCEREFLVGPGVLIPRPETEELAYKVRDWILSSKNKSDPIVIADLGAGSGALGLGLMHLLSSAGFSNLELHLIEESKEALPWLHKNISALQSDFPSTKFFVFEKNWKVWNPKTAPNILLSNPPYISGEEYESLDRSVKDYEPKSALVPEKDSPEALECYLEIFSLISNFENTPELCAFEMSPLQSSFILREVKRLLPQYSKALIQKDLCNKDRFLWLKG